MSDDHDTTSSIDSNSGECSLKIVLLPNDCNFSETEKKEYYDEQRKFNISKMRAKRARFELVSLELLLASILLTKKSSRLHPEFDQK